MAVTLVSMPVSECGRCHRMVLQWWVLKLRGEPFLFWWCAYCGEPWELRQVARRPQLEPRPGSMN